MFKLTYDDSETPKVAYLQLLNHVGHPITETQSVADHLTIDFAADGSVVGIEIIGWDGDTEIENHGVPT